MRLNTFRQEPHAHLYDDHEKHSDEEARASEVEPQGHDHDHGAFPSRSRSSTCC
jgi:hypothetical protein